MNADPRRSDLMNDIERKRIEKVVAAFVAKRRPPVHLRDQVDLSFRFDGRSVEIFEIRPRCDAFLRLVDEDEYACFFG